MRKTNVATKQSKPTTTSGRAKTLSANDMQRAARELKRTELVRAEEERKEQRREGWRVNYRREKLLAALETVSVGAELDKLYKDWNGIRSRLSKLQNDRIQSAVRGAQERISTARQAQRPAMPVAPAKPVAVAQPVQQQALPAVVQHEREQISKAELVAALKVHRIAARRHGRALEHISGLQVALQLVELLKD